MFSKKTTEMIGRVEKARTADYNWVIVKYIEDRRYGWRRYIYTHNGRKISPLEAGTNEGSLRIVEAKKLLEDVELSSSEVVIGIDEGQFYPDIREAVDTWMKNETRPIREVTWKLRKTLCNF